MSQVKSERLLNLVIALLVARSYVPKSRLRQVVAGYGGSADDAFERMFERDKDELRQLGIPIETGSADPLGDEPGYRILRSEFELPPIHLEPDEAAVLGLAARAWQHEGLARAATTALRKLQAAGVETDSAALAGVEPRMGSSDPSVQPLWQAVIRRQRVTFPYRKQGDAGASARCLEPWAVLSWRSRWYVVGHDVGRAATRVFRLSRVEGPVRVVSEPGAYEVPADPVRDSLAMLEAPEPRAVGRVRVRPGSGYGLRRRAARSDPAGDRDGVGSDGVGSDGVGSHGAGSDGAGPDSAGQTSGWDELEVPYFDAGELAGEVAALGPAAVVVAPAELRDAVVRTLRAVAEAS